MKKTHRPHLSSFTLSLLLGFILTLIAQSALAATSAVIIMYHRFGEDDVPSTNITIEQFEAHITELTSGSYNVLPVTEIVEKLKSGQSLPDRTIGITMDDAYISIYTEAWPRLKAAGLPFTVFVSTAHVDSGSSQRLSWPQIREMRSGGADFGHHSVSHLHMANASVEQITAEIISANQRFEDELGSKPKLFAYPYGETHLAGQELIKSNGFSAAFGQHSGVTDASSNFYYLPRFGLNEKFGGINRFRMLANALSLPVRDMTPADPLIGADNPPAIGFTISEDLKMLGDPGKLSCFLNHENQPANISFLGPRVEIRAKQPLPVGRTRLNCTMPTKQGRWRWFGHQFIRPE